MKTAGLRKYTVAILLCALFAFFCVTVQGFASWSNFFNLLRQTAILGIVSSGMVMVIITGNIDLSVGAVISFVSCLVAIMIVQMGMNPVLACVIGILIAIAAMVFNGIIILFTGMPAMLCTLAIMQVYQGLAYIVTKATPVYGLPESMRMIGQGYIGPIPIPVVIMALSFLASGYILSFTYPGRYFYAVGSNSEAARLSGVSITKTTIVAYALCGLTVGIAALVLMSRLFGGFPTAGSGLEMDVITAVVVGGVSFSGGKGKISGVAQGVLLMGVLSNGLGVMGASTYMQLVFKGIVLVVVVGLDYCQQKKASRIKVRRLDGNTPAL
jgi:ribose transport system permease protein